MARRGVLREAKEKLGRAKQGDGKAMIGEVMEGDGLAQRRRGKQRQAGA